jgi:very-short-patch-repair endonuclease
MSYITKVNPILPRKKTQLEDPFAQWLVFKNIKFVRQFKPFKERRFACDFYLPDYNVIIEVEGGQWINGRHQRGNGYKNDIEKYNMITLAGYKILRLTTDHFMRISKDTYTVSGYSSKILDMIQENHEKES